jgi:hypothetical protein
VFLATATLVAGSLFIAAAVRVAPGVPAVDSRQSLRVTAVDVVLKTPISRMRAKTEALPTRAATGRVVDPAVVKPPATKRAMVISSVA